MFSVFGAKITLSLEISLGCGVPKTLKLEFLKGTKPTLQLSAV